MRGGVFALSISWGGFGKLAASAGGPRIAVRMHAPVQYYRIIPLGPFHARRLSGKVLLFSCVVAHACCEVLCLSAYIVVNLVWEIIKN